MPTCAECPVGKTSDVRSERYSDCVSNALSLINNVGMCTGNTDMSMDVECPPGQHYVPGAGVTSVNGHDEVWICCEPDGSARGLPDAGYWMERTSSLTLQPDRNFRPVPGACPILGFSECHWLPRTGNTDMSMDVECSDLSHSPRSQAWSSELCPMNCLECYDRACLEQHRLVDPPALDDGDASWSSDLVTVEEPLDDTVRDNIWDPSYSCTMQGDPTSVSQCSPSTACVGGHLGEANCAMGYEGFRCSKCRQTEPKYYRFDGHCLPCPAVYPVWLVVMVVAVAFVLSALFLDKLLSHLHNVSQLSAPVMILM